MRNRMGRSTGILGRIPFALCRDDKFGMFERFRLRGKKVANPGNFTQPRNAGFRVDNFLFMKSSDDEGIFSVGKAYNLRNRVAG